MRYSKIKKELPMKDKRMAFIARGAIIIIGLCGLIMCAFWYPFETSIFLLRFTPEPFTCAENVRYWTQLIFYWATSIPCFCILMIFWKVSDAIKKDEMFSYRIAKIIKKATIILFVDIVVFLIGNIIFTCLGWNAFAIVYFIISAIGIAFVEGLIIFSYYITKAAKLKEETEGLI